MYKPLLCRLGFHTWYFSFGSTKIRGEAMTVRQRECLACPYLDKKAFIYPKKIYEQTLRHESPVRR